MATRENKVERYLADRIKSLGGLTRKWVSPNCAGVPDRIVIVAGHIWLVEVKPVAGKLAPVQIREHRRLTDAGAQVRTVYGNQGVDELIDEVVQCLNS